MGRVVRLVAVWREQGAAQEQEMQDVEAELPDVSRGQSGNANVRSHR